MSSDSRAPDVSTPKHVAETTFGIPDLCADVCSVWLRKKNLDENLDKLTERPVHFVREPATVPLNVDYTGLEDSFEAHRYRSAQEKWKNASERTLLVQCKKHYLELSKVFPNQFSSWNPDAIDFDREGMGRGDSIIGEQVLVDGIDADTVCVGDQFSSTSGLVIQVQFPRLPCFRVDHRYKVEVPEGTPPLRSGQKGTVRQYVATNGRGGFFCSVKTPGEVGGGDQWRLLARPHPDWTMERLSRICYGETPVHMTWKGTDEELQELCEMEDLGYHEWRERLIVVRAAISAERPLKLPPELGVPCGCEDATCEEASELINGMWIIEGCAGLAASVELTFDDGEFRSTEAIFGGTHFVAKPKIEGTEFILDVEMGYFPMFATVNVTKEGTILLVFSNGSVWTKIACLQQRYRDVTVDELVDAIKGLPSGPECQMFLNNSMAALERARERVRMRGGY